MAKVGFDLHRAPGFAAVLFRQRFSRGRRKRKRSTRGHVAKLTEHTATTLNKKTSVCRRRQCPTKRCDLFETELSKVTRKHRLGLCSISKKEQILAECQARINRREFQAADRRNLRKFGEVFEFQREELHRARVEKLQKRDQQFFSWKLLQQNLESRRADQKSFTEMEESKKFQSFHFRHYCKTKIIRGSKNTNLELSGRIQDLQNEINFMSD